MKLTRQLSSKTGPVVDSKNRILLIVLPQQVKKEFLFIDIDWHDHWTRWNDDDYSKSLEGLKAACVQRNNALPRAKVQLSWDETDQPGWPAFDFNIHKLEIKRAHVIKCHKSRNQISGRWKDIETGLAESDKQTMSSWVLWALNHSSPHAALLHMDHTHSFGLGWVSCLPHNYQKFCSTSHLYFSIRRQCYNLTFSHFQLDNLLHG